MSLLLRKKAKAAAKTNDLSTVTWDSMTSSTQVAETLVGKNAQIRYGIATETDMGLPETRYVLVPTLSDITDPAKLAEMYHSEVLMVGIHEAVTKDGRHITSNFPINSEMSGAAEVEWENRTELKHIRPQDDLNVDLVPAVTPDDASWLTQVAIHLNFTEFSAHYPNISEGARVLGAHAVAMAYRVGILESHATREFQFIQVVPNKTGGYQVIAVDPAYAKRPDCAIKPGTDYPGANMKINEKMVELGLGICVGAGTTHYMMNHTTGGSVLSGHNLKALTVNGVYEIDPGHGQASERDQTTFFYNVTHPVNKRAVANLCLRTSRVNCWHKNAYILSPSVIYADTFMTYRQTLVPAGAHKAFIAAAVLRDICSSKLGIFLPDQDICNTVVKMYADIVKLGARAHIGSRYYTDEAHVLNQSAVDSFLPVAAYYVQQRMPTSSYAGSPHLAPEVADAAQPQWKAIVTATIRAGATGAADEHVKQYITMAGAAGYTVDLSSEDGRLAALAVNDKLLGEISSLF